MNNKTIKKRNPKHDIVFDVLTEEELIQKLKVTEVNMRKGSGSCVKIS
jgi:hypothetical protein